MCNCIISIIIPIYNVEKYIKECIQSVISQSYKNLEIICVDDKGTDNSILIIKEFIKIDNRIKLISNDKNKGLAIARNVGLKHATGDFIYFLDSDDYLSENSLNILLKKALKDYSDVVYSGVNCFLDGCFSSEQLEAIKEMDKYLNPNINEICINTSNFFYGLKNIPCIAWAKLYKRDFLIKNNIKFINNKTLHEDNGFLVKILACNPKISFTNDNGYNYRIRNNSIMATSRDRKVLREQNLKQSIEDALAFIKSSKKNLIEKDIYKQITKDLYWYLFAKFNSKLFTFYLGSYEKRLRFLYLNIFRQTSKEGRIIKIKLFGLTIVKYKLY